MSEDPKVPVAFTEAELFLLQMALFKNHDLGYDRVLQRATNLHERLGEARQALRLRASADKIEAELTAGVE